MDGLDLLPPADCASPTNSEIDFIARVSGRWTEPATWGESAVPSRAAAGTALHVVICRDITVTFDASMDDASYIDTLRLQGTLDFDRGRSTRLAVHTLVSEPSGVLQVGTAADPIAAGNQAEIVIADQPFSTRDPAREGKGLILNGPVQMYGAPKTPFSSIPPEYLGDRSTGSDRFHLADATGWETGDEIVIAPTIFVPSPACRAERFRISKITPAGAIVLGTLDTAAQGPRLIRDHLPYLGQVVHVANLTRNVVVRSMNPSESGLARGHVKITRGGAQLHNVELRQLGRTDKKQRLDDAPNGNQRGRYPLHFHRTLESGAGRSFVSGSVVNASPGWGFVNHTSDVSFSDSVSYQVDGAGFVTETSGELGSFARNIALCGQGDPVFGRYAPRRFEGSFHGGVDDRTSDGDLAFTGDGFWVQAPLVRVSNNIAAGMQGHAFILWNEGLYERFADGTGQVAGPRLADVPACGNGDCYRQLYGDRALANDLAAALFQGNVAYASFMGVMVRFNNHPSTAPLVDDEVAFITGCGGNYAPGTTLKNTVAWNNYYGLGLSYTLNLTIDNAQILSDQPNLDGMGLPKLPWGIYADHNLDDDSDCEPTIDSRTTFRTVTINGYERDINFGTDCAESPEYLRDNLSCDGSTTCVIDHPSTSGGCLR